MKRKEKIMSKLRKIVLFLCAICFCSNAVSETINWVVDGETYATTNCAAGDDIILPTPPTKPGQVFMGWVQYQEIEYIESTGTQYIDTDWTLVDEHVIEIIADMQFNIVSSMQFTGASAGAYFGVADNWVCAGSEIGISADKKRHLFDLIASVGREKTVKCKIDTLSYSRTRDVAQEKIGIFSTVGDTYICKARIYSYKIYDNGILVRDFIPVIDPNGEVCMYDKVSHRFFYNAGTGVFIAGPLK